MNILYFDVETTGLPNAKFPPGDPMQPHVTQLGFILEINGHDALVCDTLIRPDNWRIHPDSGTGIGKIASELTGITQEMCEESGLAIVDVVEQFMIAAENADALVCHNTAFDTKLLATEYARLRPDGSPRDVLCGKPTLCTMKAATPICQIRKKDGKTGFKWPKLEEAMMYFFGEKLEGAHSAIVDIKATRRLFHKLLDVGAFDQEINDLIKSGKLPMTFNDSVDAMLDKVYGSN